GRATLAQAYAEVRDGEVWLVGLEIATYDHGNRANHEPTRARKLLLHRREIDRLYGQVKEKGLTLVPTRLYFKDSRVKVELALARGKDVQDKRRTVADREAKRQIERALKGRRGDRRPRRAREREVIGGRTPTLGWGAGPPPSRATISRPFARVRVRFVPILELMFHIG